MFSRHPLPLGAADLLLVAGIVVAAAGFFYTSLAVFAVWGWLNKRRSLRFKAAADAADQRPSAFQDRGEALRRRLLIDGTAGDAQDVDHPYIPEVADGPCLVCGLTRSYPRHYGASVALGT
jgi:hypothetical protein